MMDDGFQHNVTISTVEALRQRLEEMERQYEQKCFQVNYLSGALDQREEELAQCTYQQAKDCTADDPDHNERHPDHVDRIMNTVCITEKQVFQTKQDTVHTSPAWRGQQIGNCPLAPTRLWKYKRTGHQDSAQGGTRNEKHEMQGAGTTAPISNVSAPSMQKYELRNKLQRGAEALRPTPQAPADEAEQSSLCDSNLLLQGILVKRGLAGIGKGQPKYTFSLPPHERLHSRHHCTKPLHAVSKNPATKIKKEWLRKGKNEGRYGPMMPMNDPTRRIIHSTIFHKRYAHLESVDKERGIGPSHYIGEPILYAHYSKGEDGNRSEGAKPNEWGGNIVKKKAQCVLSINPMMTLEEMQGRQFTDANPYAMKRYPANYNEIERYK
jgi:hypothetical protein